MRIVVLYRPHSEHARRLEEYIAEFNRVHPGSTPEVIDIDSVEGVDLAGLYGVMEHPAILALKDDGQVQQQWAGIDSLPLMNDLAYYSRQ